MGVDLLAEHPDGAALFFWRLTRDQALAVIEQIHRALADGAAPGRGEG
ncbi:MAG: hypothetical protein N2483_03930 [Burkholderiaceae bacterium]|nr:hypothetical protein [Burkholderiaceae bacterium]